MQDKIDKELVYNRSIRGSNHVRRDSYKCGGCWGGRSTCDVCMHGKVQINREIKEFEKGRELSFKKKAAPKIQRKHKRKLSPKIVKLDEIRENLYLTNHDYFVECFREKKEPITSESGKVYIINMSNSSINVQNNRERYTSHRGVFYSNRIVVRDIGFREYSSYGVFLKTVINVLMIIHSVPPDTAIILNCNAGVNRSVCIAIILANELKGWSFQEAIDYIETRKENVHRYWCSLNNRSFKNKILCYLQDHREWEVPHDSLP